MGRRQVALHELVHSSGLKMEAKADSDRIRLAYPSPLQCLTSSARLGRVAVDQAGSRLRERAACQSRLAEEVAVRSAAYADRC